MPNNGVTKTEWPFIATETEEVITVNLAEWIMELLKPDMKKTGQWILLGVQNSKNSTAPRIFQFRIRDEYGVVGTTDSTLRIGNVIYDEN
jgi:hypothetical protein